MCSLPSAAEQRAAVVGAKALGFLRWKNGHYCPSKERVNQLPAKREKALSHAMSCMNCQAGGGAGGGPLGEGARVAAAPWGRSSTPEGTSLVGSTASREELHPRKSWRQQRTPLRPVWVAGPAWRGLREPATTAEVWRLGSGVLGQRPAARAALGAGRRPLADGKTWKPLFMQS